MFTIKSKRNLFVDIIASLKGFRLRLITLTFFSFLVVTLTLAISIINKQMIDEVFYQKNLDYLFSFVVYIVCIYIFSILLNVLTGFWNAKITTKIDSAFKLNFYNNILHSSLLFHKRYSDSDIYYRMFQDLPNSVNYVVDLLVNLPTKVFFVCMATAVMYTWSAAITFIYLALLACNLLIVLGTRRAIYKISLRQKNVEQSVVSSVSADIKQILLTKIFGQENERYSKMHSKFSLYIKVNVNNKFLLTIFSLLNNFASQLWSILLIIIGAFKVYNGSLSVGAFFSISSISQLATSNALGLLNYIFNYPSAKVSFDRYKEYCYGRNMAEFSGSQNFVFSSQLSISSLSYSYPGSTQPVLKDLSFTITPGKILLVRGENGSGKTTLLHIMNRLLFTYNGEVTIDEIAIDNFDYQSFRKSVGYLPQCSTVFNDTIKNNLTLGYAVENTQIDKCLEAFGMKTLIESLPQGIDTVIGENGFQLSGGNLQKLALIRLLLREYKLLLLDEPTASLDEDSKKEFRNIISRYAKEKQVAIVMVTHNSDDIQIADYQISLPS